MTREFRLYPETSATYQVVDDPTKYTLKDIVKQFPLPQKIALENLNEHKELLKHVTSSPSSSEERKVMHLLLKRETQQKFIVGEEINGENGIAVHVDAEVKIRIISDETSLSTKSEETNVKMDDNHNHCLCVQNLIWKAPDRPVVCKPYEELFTSIVSKPPALPSRPTRFRRQSEPVIRSASVAPAPDVHVRRNSSTTSSINVPSIIPEGHRVRMWTPEETQQFFNPGMSRFYCIIPILIITQFSI